MAPNMRLFAHDTPEGISSPDWDHVEQVLRGLDGDLRSEASLGPDEETGLYVVGGPERFVVWLQRRDETGLLIDTAIDPSSPIGSISVTLENGQVEEIPAVETVDLATVLRAARTYYGNQSLDVATAWQRQGPPN